MGAEHSRRHRAFASDPLAMRSDNFTAALATSSSTRRQKSLQMDRLRRTLSFHSEKKAKTSSNAQSSASTVKQKPLQWQEDEKAVRLGTCSFTVKYLGSVEVHESRGMNACEQAIQALLNHKAKHLKAILNISGDALRVIDESNKGLIVDQTIEKVSFCAPDRHHGKGFAYICRDGASRRWLCHGFLSIKETGERLSHAVGCAFQVCLEKKQRRDRECDVRVEYTSNGTSFTRFGSFRTTTLLERLVDPQSAIVAEPIPSSQTKPASSVNQKSTVAERPRPKGNNADAFIRTMSLRSDNPNQIPIGEFKRQGSLKPSDLPSIQETKYNFSIKSTISEEVEPSAAANELFRLSLIDSTNIYRKSIAPLTKSAVPIQLSSMMNDPTHADEPSIIPEPVQYSNTTPSINDALDSNLNALLQSNHPVNPFSPYGYSVAAQAQSLTGPLRPSAIFTPKRGSNPFDDDLIRR